MDSRTAARTGGQRGRIAGAVHGEEFVFSAPAVDAIGLNRLEQMHSAAIAGGGSSTSTAGAAGAAAASPVNIAVFNDEAAAMRWLGTRTGKKVLHRHLGENRAELGQET